MRTKRSLLKSLWLLLTILLILVGRGLPLGILILLLLLVLAAPVLRERLPGSDLDERQVYISHISSHVAFYVFLFLLLFIMVHDYIRLGENPPAQYYVLLLVPLLVKFTLSLYSNYEARKVAFGMAYGWLGVWTLFILFSHGFTLTALIEDVPFLLAVALAFLLRKYERLSGLIFILFAAGLTIFFRGWLRLALYVRLLMYSLVPLPLLVSGVVLLIQKQRGMLEDEA